MKYVIGGVAVAAIAVVGFLTVDLDVDGDLEMPTVESTIKVDPGEIPDFEIVKTEDGRLPSVSGDVDMRGGELPDVDVNVADVNIGSEEVTVELPDVDVKMEEETFEIPTIDVDLPEDQ